MVPSNSINAKINERARRVSQGLPPFQKDEKMNSKRLSWLGRPVFSEGDIAALERAAAKYEFGEGLPRPEAEARAHADYRANYHKKSTELSKGEALRAALRKASEGDVLHYWHVTDRDSVEEILRDGFYGGWGDYGYGVYLWDDPYLAQEYAAQGGWDGSLQDPVVLKVGVSPDRPPLSVFEALGNIPFEWEDEREKYEHTFYVPLEEDDHARWMPDLVEVAV